MDTVSTLFAESILKMDKPPGTSSCFKANSLVYDSRNQLSLIAMDQNFDIILWLDSDMIVPQDTLTKMITHYENGHQFVSGLYFKRTVPTKPVAYLTVNPPAQNEQGIPVKNITNLIDYSPGELVQVEGCGFGCVMTSVSMLRSMWDTYGPPFTPFAWASEDISFCYRAKLANHPLLCDTSISCGHDGHYVFTEQFYQHNRKRGGLND